MNIVPSTHERTRSERITAADLKFLNRQLGARDDALGAKAEKWAGCACMTPGQPRNDCHFR